MDTGSAVIGCKQKTNNKMKNKYEKDLSEYSDNEDDSDPSSYRSNKNNKNKYNDIGPSRKHTRYKPKKNNINEINDNNNNKIEKKVKKRVKFASKVTTIKVECWKKYNLEQTADENINELLKISKTDTKEKGKKGGRDQNITCTCIIF